MLRPVCPRCQRARRGCLCAQLRPQASRVMVAVLQHPREAKVSKGTGLLVRLALSNSVLVRHLDADRSPRFRELLGRFETGRVGLLFPEPDARPLEEAVGQLDCLLVPDGTWPQARTVMRRTLSLARLPRFALPPGEPSRYRIRKPPRPGALSTIESVVRALRILERDAQGYQSLLDLFERMVETQLDFMRRHGAQHPALREDLQAKCHS